MCYMLFSTSDHVPRKGLFKIPNFDKIVHFGMFCIWILTYYWDKKRNNSYASVFSFSLIAIAFGILSEYIQYKFVVSRDGNYQDFLADLCGVLIGILIAKYLFLPVLAKLQIVLNKKETR